MEQVAVKEIDIGDTVTDGALLYKTEVRALRRLPLHKNLPRLIGNCKRNGRATIVMSYFPFPSLSNYLATHGPMDSSEALCILEQLVPLRFGWTCPQESN